jgi:hypothetical protein
MLLAHALQLPRVLMLVKGMVVVAEMQPALKRGLKRERGGGVLAEAPCPQG